jgi:hypothetical protein
VGAAFHSLRPGPKINNSNDRCIFRAWLVVDNITATTASDTGIWYQDPSGALQLLALEGGSALGGADTYGTFNFNPAWTDGANYAFSSSLVLGGSGVFTGSGGAVTPVLVAGDPAPGFSSGVVGNLSSVVLMNEASQMAVKMFLQTGPGGVTASTDGAIVFRTSGGSLSIVAREGSPAADTAGKFAGLQSTDWLSLDESGKLLYYAQLASQATAPVINGTNNSGLWLYDASTDTTTLVARGADTAPGLGGVLYYVPRWGVISGGKVAFKSTLRGAVTAGVNDTAVFAGTPGVGGSLTAIARIGVATGVGAPAGAPSGAFFSVLGYPRIGKGPTHPTAFRGELKVSVGGVALANNEGIWKETGGMPQLLAREGVTPTGIPGMTLGSIGEPGVGENGRVFFTARISGAGVTTANDTVLFAETAGGGIAPILREGTILPVGLTGKTLADLHNTYSTPEDSRTMNADGTMALQAPFTDGNSGLVITNAP